MVASMALTPSAGPRPLVSIGLPVYNGERYLEQAIDTILAQTFQSWELIVSDNASNDRTEEICRGYMAREPRIRYHRQERNIGIARNFNAVIDMARADYFKWHAHDDLCAPTLVERCVEALEANPTASAAFTKTVRIDAEGATISDDSYTVGSVRFAVGSWEDDASYDSPDVVERCLKFLRPGRPAAPAYLFGVMRTNVLRATRRHGSFLAADEVLLLELLLKGPLIQVREPLFFVRHFSGNATALGLKGDLVAAQTRLDPRRATRVGSLISKYQHYWEYLIAVQREQLPPMTKARIEAHILGNTLGRARVVTSDVLRGKRTILGRARF